MLIDCPCCGNSYHIIKAVLGPTGRRVACPRCDTIWYVAADGRYAAKAQDHAEDLWAAADIAFAAGEDVGSAEWTEIVIPEADVKKSAAATGAAPPRREPSWLVIGSIALALSMAVIGFRTQIVSLWPRAATAYAALGLPVNLRGLALEHFHTITINDGFETVLGVEGQISNLRGHSVKIPPVRLAIRDAQGRRLYDWTVPAQKQRLAGGESIGFRARLAAPPAEGRDVLVDFAPIAPKNHAEAAQKSF